MNAADAADAAPQRSVFVAGAAGAIGLVLVRLLVADGWRVFGSTRSTERARRLEALGVEPVVVDVFDAAPLRDAARRTQPDALVHQLTDLPQVLDPAALPAALERNARIREQGTANLLDAFRGTPVRRLVVQSIAMAYAPGEPPFAEEHPLDVDSADPVAARSARAVATMEALALASGFDAVVLRCGRLYGPRTWSATPPRGCAVHVDAAADAARRALTLGMPGVYNVAEPGGEVDVRRASSVLGWNPAFRLGDAG